METLANQLLTALEGPICAGRIRVLCAEEMASFNGTLLDSFPASGSWPDWSTTLNHRQHRQVKAALVDSDFRTFFDDCLRERFGEVAFYANDGINVALNGTVARFREHISVFVDTLHTSYFVGAKGSWCLTLHMNGEMNYGEAPSL